MPEEVTGQAAPQSFKERKAAELSAERAGSSEPANGTPEQDRTFDETPGPELGSVQDDGIPELHGEQDELEEPEEGEEDLDEIPSDLLDGEADEETAIDWEKRYKDTQAELTRVNERRNEMDAEHADLMAGSLQLKYEMEDRFKRAETQAEFFRAGLDNQIANLEQAFSSGLIEPDHLANARAQHQSLLQQRGQLEQYVEQATSQREEAERLRKDREAEVSRTILSRTIPDWSREKYDEMRQYASRFGYSPDEFNEQVDHRFFRLLNDSMLLNGAERTVSEVKRKQKAKPPRGGRNVERAARDGKGRFRKLEKDFKENPNQRGRFAALQEERLRRERRGR